MGDEAYKAKLHQGSILAPERNGAFTLHVMHDMNEQRGKCPKSRGKTRRVGIKEGS